MTQPSRVACHGHAWCPSTGGNSRQLTFGTSPSWPRRGGKARRVRVLVGGSPSQSGRRALGMDPDPSPALWPRRPRARAGCVPAGKAHLKQAILGQEEALRLHAVCRALRRVDLLQAVLARALRCSLAKYSELDREDDFLETSEAPDIQREQPGPSGRWRGAEPWRGAHVGTLPRSWGASPSPPAVPAPGRLQAAAWEADLRGAAAPAPWEPAG